MSNWISQKTKIEKGDMNSMKRFIALLAVLSLSVILMGAGNNASAAQAKTNQNKDTAQISENAKKAKEAERAIALMEQHMQVTKGGTLSLDEKGLAQDIRSGKATGVDPAVFAKLKRNLAQTNADLRAGSTKSFSAQSVKSNRRTAIRSGEIKAADLLSTRSKPAEQAGSQSQGEGVFSAQASCPGVTKTDYYWWGKRAFLDHCRTRQLVNRLTAGAGAATVASLFAPPLAPGGAIVAAIQGIGAGGIAATDQGRGVYINYVARIIAVRVQPQ